MDEDDFTRCVEVLADDAARAGQIDWAHVVRVATARGLGEGLSDIVAALRDLDVTVVDAPVMTGDSGSSAGRGGGTLPAMLRTHKILTAEVEVILGRRIQVGLAAEEKAAGDAREPDPDEAALIADGKHARDDLVLANVRLAASVVRRYAHRAGDLDFEDLLQEGLKGLHRAADKFDPEKGFKFSTYATWWIRQAVERAIDDTGTIIRLPVHLCTEVRRVTNYARAYENRNGHRPSLTDLAIGVDMDAARVQALLDWATPVAHLDTPIATEDGGDATLGDMVLAAIEPGPEDAVIASDVALELRRRLEAVLDPRSLRIVEARYGFDGDDGLTLEALGGEFGITRERVRQLETKILEKLRSDEGVRVLAKTMLGRAAA